MKTFDLEEAAAYLRVSKDSMRDMADSGKVAGAKIGPTTGYRWIFTEDGLDDFLRSEIERQTRDRRQRSGIDRPAAPRQVAIGSGRKVRPIPALSAN